MKESIVKSQNFLYKALAHGACSYLFLPRQTFSTEATAWSIIALVSSGKETVKPAIDYLIANQNTDGGWATGPGLSVSDWTSGPATLALRIAMHYQPQHIKGRSIDKSLRNATHYLLGLRVDFLSPVARLLLLLSKGISGLHYGRGWPWDINCYNWVEPTAYCLMALKLPQLIKEDLAVPAIFHANKFLLEHACKDGGWNHGCFYSLGVYYPPYRVTTAEALLALTDAAADNNQIQAALQYISKIEESNHSAMSLAWTALALDVYGCDNKQQLDELLRMQNENGSFGSNYLVTALSLLALNTVNGINPLRPLKSNTDKVIN